MSHTKQQLETILLKIGNSELANLWDCSPSDVSKKISGSRNISLEDFANMIDSQNLKIIDTKEISIIPRDELVALTLFANRYLSERVNGGDDNP